MEVTIKLVLIVLLFPKPANAAIALVQATGLSGSGFSGSEITVASTGSGHLFILSLARWNSGSNTISITDNASGCVDTWTDTGAHSPNTSGAFQVDTFWVKASGCSGVTRIKVTLPGGGLYRATFFEVSGITNPTVERMNANNSNATIARNPSGASVTTAASSSFIVASLGFGGSTITGKHVGNSFISSNTYDRYAGTMYLITSVAGTYTPQWASTNSQVTSSSTVSFASATSTTTWYISPTGSDANSGTSPATPWLTPFHFVNCGDIVQATAATTYLADNFASGKWGTVNCPANNNVAWLKCVTFDTCKIGGRGAGMFISASYWGVQGWEVTSSGSNCFVARPPSTSIIHHIIFANDIANTCAYAGFEIDGSLASVDYFVVVGSIAYKTSGAGTGSCTSGINAGFFNGPVDTAPGTHIYFAGNFSYDTVEHNPCNGGSPTDGEGLFFDTLNMPGIQAVIDNNIAVFNGGRGVMAYLSPTSALYIRHNTTYGNNTQKGQSNLGICGEITVNNNSAVEVFGNLAQTTATGGCAGNTIYTYAVLNGNVSNKIYSNYGYDSFANNIGVYHSAGFVPGPNNTFLNPGFANPIDPGAPNCGSFASVTACMATTIANFTPTTAAAKPYGYQPASLEPVYDPLFPEWLCNVNLPTGLVTEGCALGGAIR